MADDARRREILHQVAAGEVTPEEAAELLALSEAGGDQGEAGAAASAAPAPAAAAAAAAAASSSSAPPTAPAPPPPPPSPAPPAAGAAGAEPATPVDEAGSEPPSDSFTASFDASADPFTEPAAAPSASGDQAIAIIRIRSNCRAVSIVGDPDVHTAVAEGEHSAHVDGDTLTIESTLERSTGFAFLRSPGGRARGMVRVGTSHVRPLVVRMNPDLALESNVDAGSMTIRGVLGPIRAHTSAGALRIDGFDAPLEIKVAAGSATARGRLDHGASRIECDAGKVSLHLTHDSSVQVRGRVNLGQLSAPERVGAGLGTLDVVANVGAVEIAVEDAE
jgi:hypothetical protein